MKRTTIWLGALALMVGDLAACGGDDDGGDALSLEDYFTRLEEAAQEFASDGQALTEAFDERIGGAGDDIEVAISFFKEYFEDMTAVFETFVDAIDELNPPDEAADEHDEAVSSGRETIDAFEQLISDVDGVDNEEEFLEVVGNADDPSADFTAACRDLEEVAVDGGTNVDLQCAGVFG